MGRSTFDFYLDGQLLAQDLTAATVQDLCKLDVVEIKRAMEEHGYCKVVDDSGREVQLIAHGDPLPSEGGTEDAALILTDDQITTVFNGCLGFPPRAADLGVLRMLGADVTTVAEYIWNHFLGEPDEPDVKTLVKAIQEGLKLKKED
jgi:hypothetical protein